MFSPDDLWSHLGLVTLMWRYRRVEMLENGNVGLLRCLIVEKWRSLVGI